MESKVKSLLVDRIVKAIEDENRLPWDRSSLGYSINWYSKREYRGINRLLLGQGEYITLNQLKEYNSKLEPDDRYYIQTEIVKTCGKPVYYYARMEKELTSKQYDIVVAFLQNNPAYMRSSEFNLVQGNTVLRIARSDDGSYKSVTYVDRYYTVFSIEYAVNKDGVSLINRIGPTGDYCITVQNAQDIVDSYCSREKIRIEDGEVPYYSLTHDMLELPNMNDFASSEDYYRLVFHELIHSTSEEHRLNREGYNNSTEYDISRENLIAEVGSLFLATEAGFEKEREKSSLDRVNKWSEWIRGNKSAVVNAVFKAETAVNYILTDAK
jgi:antirestriction protein ArdC